jgi:hypothetical protein
MAHRNVDECEEVERDMADERSCWRRVANL